MDKIRSCNECVLNDLPLMTITSVAATSTSTTENLDIDAKNEQKIYSDTFLNSCAELASHADSVCGDCNRENEDCRTTWFSQVRRRCSTIRNWLPKMCSCLETSTAFFDQSSIGNYRRLSGERNIFEFGRSTNMSYSGISDESEQDEEKSEELQIYCENGTCCKMIIGKNLRAIDLCELVKAERHVIGFEWSIVEIFAELGIERTLEDHEDILSICREAKAHPIIRSRRLLFRRDHFKYEFFYDPRGFFPDEMMQVPVMFADNRNTLTEAESTLRVSQSSIESRNRPDSAESFFDRNYSISDRCWMFQGYLTDEEVKCPEIFDLVWIQIGRLNVWRRIHLLLRDRKLYQAKKITKRVYPLAHLSDYVVYTITNARRRFKAPFPWGICLRPSSNTKPESTQSRDGGLKVIAFHSEKSRACWLTAMRLAKYGKQLRENYRAFKNKQCEQTDNSKDRYVSYNVSNESVRSRVAMDFTGSVGRIVDDPKEAKCIAESEGVNWRRTWRPFSRPPPGCAMVRLHGLDDGIHVLQPWFHRGLRRDIAAAIVRDYGSADGVFLVRESKSNMGAYVLTYKYSDKVFHAQIQPVFDERCNCWLYTLDKGVTRFYDLLQLIEFYQLNAGCLPTRLTHYVQQDVPAMLPLPVPLPQSEDSCGSPSLPELGRRFGTEYTSEHKSI